MQTRQKSAALALQTAGSGGGGAGSAAFGVHGHPGGEACHPSPVTGHHPHHHARERRAARGGGGGGGGATVVGIERRSPWMVTARISRLGWGVAAQSTVGTVIQTVEPTLGIGV